MDDIKKESVSDVFDEVFDRNIVKYEPREIKMLGNCDLIDHKNATYKYEEHSDENYVAVELNTKDVGSTDLSTIPFNEKHIKSENNIDIYYKDIKTEVEKNPAECEYDMCQNIKESASDVFNISKVKHEPDERSLTDHRYVTFEYHENNVELKIEDVDFTDLSPMKREAEQIKCDDEVDMHYEDIKSELIEKKPWDCENESNNLPTNSEMFHVEEKPFRCKICLNAFAIFGRLKRHEKIHTGEKPFHCKICSKAFATSECLKRHERIHTGEKPFQCKICLKGFSQPNTLKRHGMIHTGERPFHCTICSKAFVNPYNLKRHVRIHTGEKPFQCMICSKTFSLSDNLKRHQHIHTRET